MPEINNVRSIWDWGKFIKFHFQSWICSQVNNFHLYSWSCLPSENRFINSNIQSSCFPIVQWIHIFYHFLLFLTLIFFILLVNNQIFKNKIKLVKVQNKEKAQICNVQVLIVNVIFHEIWEQKTLSDCPS